MSSDLPMAVVFNCHYNGLSILQELGRRDVPCTAMDSSRSPTAMRWTRSRASRLPVLGAVARVKR